jgi:short-subunit dehydrogenase
VVNGCLAALPHLKANGGALITVGSEVSDAYPPLMGIYTATKHAVKGYVDTLRVEVEEVDRAPVAVTLIQPTAVDTPFPQHARNFTHREPMLPKPRVEPKDVAEAILAAAETPTRAKAVGAMSLVNTTVAKLVPGLGDKMAARQADRMHYDEPPRHPGGALHRPSEAIGIAGMTHGPGGKEPE